MKWRKTAQTTQEASMVLLATTTSIDPPTFLDFTEEAWFVETSRDGKCWHANDEGPHAIYGSMPEAMAWARKLRIIHAHVRLVRSIHQYYRGVQ